MTVWHNVFERGGAEARRDAADPWRLLRHRHHGDPDGQGVRRQGHRHRRLARTRPTPACKLGADHAINYKTEDFVAEVKAATGGAGANVILDMVGGDYIDRNYDAAAVDGRIVQIALLGGPKATVNFAKLMMKRLHHTGSTLRPRSNADKAAMVAAIEAKVMPLLRDGRVKPLMDSTFPLEKAADAHRRMETSEHIGKIVLTV